MARTATPKTDSPSNQPPDNGTQTDLVRATLDVFEPGFDELNLWQKIARITGMVGGVEKRGFNAFHKYHYVMEADLVTAVRHYLAVAGIVIIPDVLEVTKEGELTSIMVNYIVTDGKENFTFRMPGYGSDRGDKGVYKAITGSNKYALMKLFKIETGDDPEGDTRVDERTAVSQPPARPTTVTGGERGTIGRGAHTSHASPVQIRRVSEILAESGLERIDLFALARGMFSIEIPVLDDEKAQAGAILSFLQGLTSEQAGQLLIALSTAADVKANLATPASERRDAEAEGLGAY